jgi:hypothetical protein
MISKRPSQVGRLGSLAAIGILALGCSGSVGDQGGSPGGPGNGGPGGGGSRPGPGSAPGTGMGGSNLPPPAPVNPSETTNLAGPRSLRRLTLLEYANTIRDLLGVAAPASRGGGFSVDIPSTAGFLDGAKITSSVDAKQFVDASEALATAAVAKLGDLLPGGCFPVPAAAGAQDDCARKFIETFGLRAYRRPVTVAEAADMFDFYKALRGGEVAASFGDAIKDLIAGIIQTPQFLYRWELGEAPIKDGPLFRLNSWEIASRLSYFLWASMPDDRLFTAARNGELQNLDRIAQEARRMLGEARAKDAVRDFHLQWLDVEGLPDMQKDPSFAAYTPETAQSMLNETAELASSILLGPQATGKLGDLFSSPSSIIDGRLAKVYGVGSVTGEDLRRVALDPEQRAGLLTHGSFLAAHADADLSHPVKRGVHIARNVLCLELPDPDGLEIPELPAPRPNQTTRERYAAHEQGACAACHIKIDTVGFAFENYDATGGFRTTEAGKPVDSSGTVSLPSGDIRFTRGIDFIKAVAGTPELRGCVARQWLRYVLRRQELPEEAGSLEAIDRAFEASGWDVRELLVAVTRTRAFTHRKPGADEGI